MGTKVTYQFNAYRVCVADEAQLLEDDNPMALAVLAAKYLNETKDNKELRYRYKLKLIEVTRKEGWTKEQAIALLQFIDLMVILPEPLEIEFKEEIITKYDIMNTATIQKSEIAEFFSKQYDEIEAMKARAKDEARREAKMESAKSLLLMTDLTSEQIANALQIPLKTVIELEKEINTEG